ncbi:2-hydroxyacylsphingosine 1-beta-galactosyltransferase [Trichoplax sp. H2]|nr:2-hydroxyacylsphingosine 1-beta-galactosyltransferase [Trichoplax sp. H2]|eukprot:RDD41365.1 2-hydroxyacylsphingosine 1-beta-galactosyltransferase [Trichoplax sp. H2]
MHNGLICDFLSYICQIVAGYTKIPIQIDILANGFIDPLTAESFHMPSPTAYVPQIGMIATNKMNLFQRIINTILGYTISIICDKVILDFYIYQKVNISHLGFSSPPKFSFRKATFLLVNSDFALDYPRPLPPHVKVVGPILSKPAVQLPENLEAFIAANRNGTILVSFGTIINLNNIFDLQILLYAFARLPYHVIWKCNTTSSLKDIPNNVQVLDWVPQNDVLGHPNVIGFVTHCGVNSVLEAAYHSVPIVGLPIAGDQVLFAQKVQSKNTGVILNIKSFTGNDLFHAITKITTDPWIRGNTSKISRLIKNRCNHRTPKQEAGDWIEFALNSNGGNYLRTEEYNLYWYQLHLIDVAVVLVIIGLLMIKVIMWICRRVPIRSWNLLQELKLKVL